jgi:hypothetical protein
MTVIVKEEAGDREVSQKEKDGSVCLTRRSEEVKRPKPCS